MFEASEITTINKDWITALFIIVLLLLAFLKSFFNERLKHTSVLFFSKKYLHIYYNKEKNITFNLFQIPAFLILVISLSMVVYLSNLYFLSYDYLLHPKGYLLIFSGLTLYFVFKFLINLIIALLFNFNYEKNKLAFDKMSYFNNVILWILPTLILSVYFKNFEVIFLNITLIILAFTLALRYALFIANNKNFILSHLFYFILYLCALEIAPLVIIFKLTI